MIDVRRMSLSRRQVFGGCAALGLLGSAVLVSVGQQTQPLIDGQVIDDYWPTPSSEVHWSSIWQQSPGLNGVLPLTSLFNPGPVKANLAEDFPKPAGFFGSVILPKAPFMSKWSPKKIWGRPVSQPHEMATTFSLGIPSAVKSAIKVGATKNGLPAGFIAAVAWLESRFEPGVVRAGNNASGLFQFLADTWLYTIFNSSDVLPTEYVERTSGLYLSQGMVFGPRAVVSDVLSWRLNPLIASIGAGHEMARNGVYLTRTFGRPATKTDLYLSHALGLGGATSFISAASRGDVIPAYVVGGNGKMINGPTATDAYDKLASIVNKKMAEYRSV